MESGIKFLKIDIRRFDDIRTNVVATPIPKPSFIELPVARTGHKPIRRIRTGFSLSKPFVNIFQLFMIKKIKYQISKVKMTRPTSWVPQIYNRPEAGRPAGAGGGTPHCADPTTRATPLLRPL